MSPSDISEKGLETLIVRYMTGEDGLTSPPSIPWIDWVADPPALYRSATHNQGTGWIVGFPAHYDRTHALDPWQLFTFLYATQPEKLAKLNITNYTDPKDSQRLNFLTRLSTEIGKRGVIDVLRQGCRHGQLDFDLFYGTPSPDNPTAIALHAQNRFSVTRQLRYSNDETMRSLDLVLFINGLPIITFELKNRLTKQTVEDAVQQYRYDRKPSEKLFGFGRCIVHFAVDDAEVQMCTELKGKKSWFLPFNRGYNDGAGNPPNPDGLKTDYLWKQILTPASLTDIVENYAQIVEQKDEGSQKKKKIQIFPRYHQLEVVRQALFHAQEHGVGHRYLIQHSAGSGKSNSIAWLAHQLIGLKKDNRDLFDSIIVITDRRILDTQIGKTIKQFMQVRATVGHALDSGDLRTFLAQGKKIIISTVQKFPFILEEIANEAKERTFALIIDEAHSSQGGKHTAAVSAALTDPEDTINDALDARIQARKMLTNASYFAFTATPKNKTLEMFGEASPADAEGKVKHRPFHSYTMKQAIQEGFILDVLKSYTPVDSYYKLVKKIEADPEFDTRKAQKKLRKYVESHDYAIRLKAEIMVDHFHEHVIALAKIGGRARAMVVCNGIERAIRYFKAFQTYLAERKSSYKAIVTFSGEYNLEGIDVTEVSLNGFSSADIASKIQEDPYRFLICADKFQTGYDEPLLHTMYVDKPLAGIKAVQTLSRLNRAHPEKHDVFVLDFQNDINTITEAFSDYYRTTLLAEETDPNKLHDLKNTLDNAQVYSPEQIEQISNKFLQGNDRDELDPILDMCVEVYNDLDENEQVEFKGKAKAFARTYDFLATVLPYANREWEKLSIVLHLLIPKLPAPKEEDRSKGILETIDMESYRIEKRAVQQIVTSDKNAEIAPVPVETTSSKKEVELDRLSTILKTFNDHFGTLFTDADRVACRIRDDIVPKVTADPAYQNAKKNTPHTASIELAAALGRVMVTLLQDDTELYKQFVQNESFKRWITDTVSALAGGTN